MWRERATWQVKLRWWVPPAIAATVLLGSALGFDVATVPILGVAVAILAYNVLLAAAFSRLDRSDPRATEFERRCELIQVSLDYAAMFLLVVYTGGASSPLIWFLAFHVVFAAVLFRSTIAWLFAAIAVGGVWLVAVAQAAGWLTPGEIAFSGETLFPIGQPMAVFLTLLAFTVAMAVTATVTTAIVARLRRSNTRAYNAVETLVEERSQYMLQMAHNTRAPLAAAISMLDVLVDGYVGELDERQREYIERAKARLNALNGTLGDLLQLALSRQRAEQAVRAPVDVPGLVADVVAVFEDRATEEGVRLDLQPSDPPAPSASGALRATDGRGTVVGDREALQQVFENLVSNALKYTPRGGEVRVVVGPEDEGLLPVVVKDTGIGVPAGELPQLFSPFYRASNARDSDVAGSGLGLTMVKETVEAHGGSVELNSEEGVGTLVAVRLPLAPGA